MNENNTCQIAADWRQGPVIQAETTQGMINFPKIIRKMGDIFSSHPCGFHSGLHDGVHDFAPWSRNSQS